MKTIFRFFHIPLFAVIMFLAGPSVKAQPTTYTWVNDDGNPYHMAAMIVLSSPSGSADQFYQDFFPDSFLQYDIRFSYQGHSLRYSGDADGMFFDQDCHITWDDSSITSLWGEPGQADLVVTQNSIMDIYWPFDPFPSPIHASGSWQNIPDGGNTMAYLIAVVFPLFVAASFLISQDTRSTSGRGSLT